MNIRKYITFGFVLFNLVCVYGQKVDDNILINNIKKDVTAFFVNQNVLNKDEVKNDLGHVFITEIHDEKVIGYNKIGIYSIGVYQSHSKKHILIKENNNYKIYDIKQIDKALKAIIDFSMKNKIDKEKMLYYLKNVIQRYDDNYNFKSATIEQD